MDRPRLVIVIPAHNEAVAIGKVISGARQFGTVVVVDDASTDQTAATALEQGADVVRLGVNEGYDGALEAGVRRAKALNCAVFITMDADGQHNPDSIPEFLKLVEGGADVVVGERDRFQRFGEWLFAVFGRRLWGIKDPLCGMKCYRMSAYDDLGHFDSYGSIGTELSIHAARRGRRIANVSVMTRPRIGQSRFGAGWRANRRILRALVKGVLSGA